MKGLLKGLRYISQIFGAEEEKEKEEQEIEIGFPTDVKHVAHIGWEGPASHDPPSWMKEYKSSNENNTINEPPRKKDPSSKSRKSTRPASSKESSSSSSLKDDDGINKSLSHQTQESSQDGTSSVAQIPTNKKTRKKKAKEMISGSGNTTN